MPPYDDPLIIAGQGTIGREIVEDLGQLLLKPEIVVVGASGGGLAAGISLGVKARVPEAKFYTAEPEGFDDTLRSFKSGKRETNARMSGTICDALMTPDAGRADVSDQQQTDRRGHDRERCGSRRARCAMPSTS